MSFLHFFKSANSINVIIITPKCLIFSGLIGIAALRYSIISVVLCRVSACSRASKGTGAAEVEVAADVMEETEEVPHLPRPFWKGMP